MNFIYKEYIKDDDGNCRNKKAMKCWIKGEQEANQEYLDIEDYATLGEWWNHHYDPHGIAASMTYHTSIFDDVLEMIKSYNMKNNFLKSTVILGIEDVNEGKETSSIVLIINGVQEDDSRNYCTPLDVFKEDVMNEYSGAPFTSMEYSFDERTLVLSWNNRCLEQEK